MMSERETRIRQASTALAEKDRVKGARIPDTMELKFSHGGGEVTIRATRPSGKPSDRVTQDERHVIAHDVFKPLLEQGLREYEKRLNDIINAPIDQS